MENLTFKDIIDLGSNAVYLFFIFKLWERLTQLTDVMIKDRDEARAERLVIAQQVGARLLRHAPDNETAPG